MADHLSRIGKNIFNHDVTVKKGNVSGSATSTGSFGQLVTSDKITAGGLITTPGGIDAVGPISFQTTAAANDIKFQTAGTSGYPLILRNSNNSARMYFQTNSDVTNIIMDGNSKSNLLKLSADGLTETRGQVGSAHADGNLELYSNNGLNNLILSASMTTISGSGDTTLDVKGNIFSEGNISGSATSTGSFGVLDLIKYAPSSTGGTLNTVFGKYAGSGLVTNGNYNSLYGANAGEDLSTGDDNVIIGYNAAKSVTTTSDMVVIGAYAMEGADANDVGTQGSVAIGYKSNYAATDTSRNVSVGFETLMTETTGDESVAIGYKALKTQNGVQGSVGNVAVGREALLNTTTGIKNLALGDQAGKLITTGTKNTIIGAGANPSSGSSENEIVIGSGSIGLGDNQTVIGNSSQTHVVFGGDALISGSAQSTGSFGVVTIDGSPTYTRFKHRC